MLLLIFSLFVSIMLFVVTPIFICCCSVEKPSIIYYVHNKKHELSSNSKSDLYLVACTKLNSNSISIYEHRCNHDNESKSVYYVIDRNRVSSYEIYNTNKNYKSKLMDISIKDGVTINEFKKKIGKILKIESDLICLNIDDSNIIYTKYNSYSNHFDTIIKTEF